MYVEITFLYSFLGFLFLLVEWLIKLIFYVIGVTQDIIDDINSILDVALLVFWVLVGCILLSFFVLILESFDRAFLDEFLLLLCLQLLLILYVLHQLWDLTEWLFVEVFDLLGVLVQLDGSLFKLLLQL